MAHNSLFTRRLLAQLFAALALIFAAAPASAQPTVTGVRPASGTTSGGTDIVIRGSQFTGATAVTIGGAPVFRFTVLNATTITATTPLAATAGNADVTVDTPTGSATGTALYSYVAPGPRRHYSVKFSGATAVPPSPAVGEGLVTIDTNQLTMRVVARFSGLTSGVTVSHVHASTLTPGEGNAGVATTTPTFPGFPPGATSGFYDRNFDMTDPLSYNVAFINNHGGTVASAFSALALAIDGRRAYWNIHTVVYPAGEIRGYTVPLPSTDFPLAAPGAPSGVAAGPDGALWFTERDASKIGRINTAGVITEFALPASNRFPGGITRGPDGNLWFVEQGMIGRITPTGAITEFPHTVAASGGVTAGSDGALWFTGAGGFIGRITPAGATSQFKVPGSGQPTAIAAGADGALWFTEQGSNRVSRITTAGVFSSFPIPTAGVTPLGIAAGGDGALWFTERRNGVIADRIGRITLGGVISEFQLSGAVHPNRITAGPDGALWFTELNADKIGRITTGGVISEFAAPDGPNGLEGLAAGPDGAIWFAEAVTNRIGRLSVPAGVSYAVAGAANFDATPANEILWRGSDGSAVMWFLNNGSLQSGQKVSGPLAGWSIAGAGDFSGDGKRDIFWRNAPGLVTQWTMNGATRTATSQIGSAGPQWRIAAIADFDGGGKADILWRNMNGAVSVWLTGGIRGAVANVGWDRVIAGVGDFNADGKADILWRGVTGNVEIWLMNGATRLSSRFVSTLPLVWNIDAVGDFDGNAKADILWRNAETGARSIWLMNGATIIAAKGLGVIDAAWNVAGLGDFNADQKADILWRKNSGEVSYWAMNGAIPLTKRTLGLAP